MHDFHISYYSRSDFALRTRSRWFPEDRWSGAWYQTEEDFWHGGGDATCGNHGGGTHTPTPPGRRKSAPSFFFYIRERGKKNHRFSLRSTRRQLYESLPWSLDLRHISSDVLHDPSPTLSFVFYPFPAPFLRYPPPLDERREKKILFIS